MNNDICFSMDHDMRKLYSTLYKKYKDGYPEVLIFNQLEDDQTIADKKLSDGRRILYLKDADDEQLLETIYQELENPQCGPSNIPCTWHELSNKDVAKWCMYACYIADSLNIKLEQIVFYHTGEPSGYSGVFPTFIADDMSVPEMLICIAHELRHAWQHVYQPAWFESYIHAEDDEEAYYAQIAEIDAEAFGIKVEGMVTGINLLDSAAGFKFDPDYREALRKRMNEIDVVLSQKKIKEIRKMIELDRLLEEVKNKKD